MFQSYREEIDEFVKYIAQPYQFSVFGKKMLEPRSGHKPENEILLKKEVGVPPFLNIKKDPHWIF